MPPLKRTKVSRACDECRRKKVRCDAMLPPSSNTPAAPCSQCLKSRDACTFERTPLKRGPSKGFSRSLGPPLPLALPPLESVSPLPRLRSDSGSLSSILNPVRRGLVDLLASDASGLRLAVLKFYNSAPQLPGSLGSSRPVSPGSVASSQRFPMDNAQDPGGFPPAVHANLEFYYSVVHRNFPVLPMRRSEFEANIAGLRNLAENRVLLDVFAKVLQILVRVIKKDDINILNPSFDDAVVLARKVFIKAMLHPLLVQLFQLYPLAVRYGFGSALLLLDLLNLAGYIVVNSGERDATPMSMAFCVLCEVCAHRSPLRHARSALVAGVLDAIHSFSFGVPRIFAAWDFDKNSIDMLCDGNNVAASHYRAGLVLCGISAAIQTKKSNASYASVLETVLLRPQITLYAESRGRDFAATFLTVVERRYAFIDVLCSMKGREFGGADQVRAAHQEVGHSASQLLFAIIDALAAVTEHYSEFQLLLPGPPRVEPIKKLLIQLPYTVLLYRQAVILTNVIQMTVASMGFSSEFSVETEEGFRTLNVFEQDLKLVYGTYLPLVRPFNDTNNYGITDGDRVNNDYCVDLTQTVFGAEMQLFDGFLEGMHVLGQKQVKYRYVERGGNLADKWSVWRRFVGVIGAFLKLEDVEGWLI